MPHIISNTGIPSLSRNHARQNGVWQTFDGLSYTCKIGNFVYDWVIEANGKVFLAVQSPTPTFSYKSYAVGECDYFGIQFGTGDPKDKDLEKSKLIDPPTNYPDPCLFNANWQDVDGSMISWISNENNTGVSSSTFVMVSGKFYDLGRPILGAALNDGFIIAVHQTTINGEVIFCEYSTKDSKNGSVTNRFEKKINEIFSIDADEISNVDEALKELDDNKNSIDLSNYNAARDAEISKIASDYKVSIEVATTILNNKKTTPDSILQGIKADDIKNVKKIGFDSFNFGKFYIFKKRILSVYKKRLELGFIYSTDYRDCFSTKTIVSDTEKSIMLLLHLNGSFDGNSAKAADPRAMVNFTDAVFKSNLCSSVSNGFATFEIKINWTNKTQIEEAIKNNATEIPEKKFTYDIKFLKSKRFKEPILDFTGSITDDMEYGTTSFQWDSLVARGKLKQEVFLFAEFSHNEPKWISALVDVEISSVVSFTDYINWTQFGWHEVV